MTKKDLLLFSLVCLQISFPDIYDLLSSNPEFLKWDEETAFEVTKLAEEKDADKFNRDLDIVSSRRILMKVGSRPYFESATPSLDTGPELLIYPSFLII